MATLRYIVIGTNPYYDTSVATGTYRERDRAERVAQTMTRKGWNTEIVTLSRPGEIPNMREA